MKASDYPILAAAAGSIGYDDATLVARTIAQLLSEPTNIEDLM